MGKQVLAIGGVIQLGRALYITLPKEIANSVGLKKGDRVAARVVEGKYVVLERIPLEDLARIDEKKPP
jgi:AbrB family looped-hinge helix DNA binding protein